MEKVRRLAGMGLLVLACLDLVGCAQEPAAENVRHRLFVSNYAGEESGKCYVVLRYDDLWRDAKHSRRVGLIKFRTAPEPTLIDHRWVWGKPVGEAEFVLFDAKRNRTVRRTDYIERKTLEDGTLLAFADASGRLEVVRPDGTLIVPDEAGFTEVRLAKGSEEGLELRLGREGRWETLWLETAGPATSTAGATDSMAGIDAEPIGPN